jgi:hypothetical protein
VTDKAAAPARRINIEYAKPFLRRAIKKAIGVDIPIGVNAIPTVRGNRKIPTSEKTPRVKSKLTNPEPNKELLSLLLVQAAPKYEKSSPIPAINPIISSSILW